jgi:hypothetical protein
MREVASYAEISLPFVFNNNKEKNCGRSSVWFGKIFQQSRRND